MAQLENDPEFVERRRKQDAELRRLMEEDAREEAPVVEALRAAGSSVSSVWDLVNTGEPYPELVPVLLEHLDRPYPKGVREGIARALAVPEARIGWDQLVRSYLAETDTSENGMKFVLHLAVAAAADASVLDTLIELALDRRHGGHRGFFVDALARLRRDARAKAALAVLAEDPDVAEDVRRVLKRRQNLLAKRRPRVG